jgi:hypothetical protein
VDTDLLQFEMLTLLSYLAVSARGCVDEPPLYGPFRLVDAMSRLIRALEAAGLSEEAWAALQAYVDENKYTVMDETADYRAFLDEVVARVVPLLEAA